MGGVGSGTGIRPNARKEITWRVDENGCHICTSHNGYTGGAYHYPCIWRNGRQVKLVKYLYESKYGRIPKGLIMRHTCDNIKCINVEHIVLGTQADNTRDMIERGRANFFGRKANLVTLK